MRNVSFICLAFVLFGCTPEEKPKEKAVEVKTYTIEQLFKNNRIASGRFSEDETKLLVSSDETGIFNLFEITIADKSKKQLTFSEKESYFAIDYVPGTSDIIYASDKGGNELSHIYLLNDKGESTDLTPGENEKVGFNGWSHDYKSFKFTSNKRDPMFFDVYKMTTENWETELIYTNTDGFNIGRMSDDMSVISLSEAITTSENKLFLDFIDGKDRIEISDVPGKYRGAGFSNDNQFFFYTTDASQDFTYLVQYEIATGAKTTLYETNWDVMYSYLSKDEKYRVIGVNEDGKNSLLIQDNASGKNIDFPDIPDGDVLGVSIARSENKMRLSIGTSKAPTNLYVYDFDSKELKKLTETMNPEINADDLVSAEVVRYKSFDGLEIPSIYYKPLNASPENKVPALVFVHGGPGGQSRVGYTPRIQYLVNHGYAILAVNNRGSSGYGSVFHKMDDLNHGEKDLQDCIWGKKWLQEQDYIDTSKIGIMGGSYGGYMTMRAMTHTPYEFKVGVNLFGVTNWIRTLRSIPPYWEAFRKALYAELGDPYSEDSVRLYEISPLFHAGDVRNPVLVLQGANDPRVLQIESDEMVANIKENNVVAEYVIFADEGHGFVKKENQMKASSETLKFLDKYLKGIEEKSAE